MKRKNFKRKIFSCIAIWSVFIGSLLLYSPDSNAIAASGAPGLTITAPTEGALFNVSKVEFTGSVTDDTTPADKLQISVLEQQGNPVNTVDITDEGKLTSPTLTDPSFSYSKEFSLGTHTVIIRVTDGENITNVTRTFTVNYVVDMKLIKDITDPIFDATKSMTEVPLDYKIHLVLTDDGTTQTSQPVLKIKSTNGGEITTNRTTDAPKTAGTLEYTFAPMANLVPKTTYYVYLNPSSANLDSEPSLFKFTTESDKNALQEYQFESDHTVYDTTDPNIPRQPDYIHGKYSDVTNSCAYCHSTHKGLNEKLQGGKYGNSQSNLCMACHDGTVASQISAPVDKKSSYHQDPKLTNSDQTSSCTSCHDPHLSWDKNNPNLLKPDQLAAQ